MSVKKEGDGAEAPKKKKNIIRVYHAQNASDGGKNRKKPAGERKPRPQAVSYTHLDVYKRQILTETWKP